MQLSSSRSVTLAMITVRSKPQHQHGGGCLHATKNMMQISQLHINGDSAI